MEKTGGEVITSALTQAGYKVELVEPGDQAELDAISIEGVDAFVLLRGLIGGSLSTRAFCKLCSAPPPLLHLQDSADLTVRKRGVPEVLEWVQEKLS